MSCAALEMSDPREEIYQELMRYASGDENHDAIASMYASWQLYEGAMPDWLGLTPEAYVEMMAWHFPGADIPDPVRGNQLDHARLDEMGDLKRLIMGSRGGRSPAETWIADLLIAGCMAADHLWQDLGLWNRAQLSALMNRNFPGLAARNVKDMKWKKFLYKQLCETEGIYTCRAPTCEQCADYDACFGPEE